MTKRNKPFLRRWVRHLRSGEYEQGRKGLKKEEMGWGEGGFCPLGVACQISEKVREVEVRGRWTVYEGPEGETTKDYLPSAFADWVGITFEEMEKLSDMNDSGKSFEKIADYIENELLGEKQE